MGVLDLSDVVQSQKEDFGEAEGSGDPGKKRVSGQG